MLRRAENVRVSHQAFIFTGKGWLVVTIGKKPFRVGDKKVHKTEVAQRRHSAATFPVRWCRIGDRTYYEFQGKFYWDNDDLTAEQVHALLVTRQQRQQRTIDRAQAMVAMGEQRQPVARGAIADDVKQFVWMRDGGKCVHCGSTVELQYDHIIPVAMGGSSEQENLQILCGPCNRRKSAGLTMGHVPTQPTEVKPLPPAGWFPNPNGEGQRYWDGKAWTEHVHS